MPSDTDEKGTDPLRFDERALKLIAAGAPTRSKWTHAIMLLLLTVFVLFGLHDWGFEGLLFLMIVITIHEAGHYLAMRAFGFKDVRVFFIPFLGALMTGQKARISPAREGIMLLAGPVPGILIGLVVLVLAFVRGSQQLLRLAEVFLVLNGFNLLPLYPLDGGQIVNLTIFRRQRHVEAAFRIVAGLVLVLIGFKSEAWLLAILGVSMVLSVGASLMDAGLARGLRAEFGERVDTMPDVEKIPTDLAARILEKVKELPKIESPERAAARVHAVWGRIHERPTGVGATFALLGTYAVVLLMAVVGFAAAVALPMTTVSETADGTRCETVLVGDDVVFRCPLSEEGRYHGESISYFAVPEAPPGTIAARGHFTRGMADGMWEYMDYDGSVIRRVEFESSRVVRIVDRTDIGWTERNTPDLRVAYMRDPYSPWLLDELRSVAQPPRG